jgi:hypothetical protein
VAIFCFGLTLLFSDEKNCWRGALLAALTTLFLGKLFGSDLVILTSLTWLPLLLWVLLRAQKLCALSPLLWILLVVFFSFRISSSAHQFTILLLGVAVFLLPRSGRTTVLWLGFLLLSLRGFDFSLPAIPHYPALARVVPDDGVAGLVRPLLGPGFELQIIDRRFIRDCFFGPALLMLLLVFWQISFLTIRWLRGRKAASFSTAEDATVRRGMDNYSLPLCTSASSVVENFCSRMLVPLSLVRRSEKVSAIIALCIACDCLLPEELALIAPLQTLARVLPGLFLYPLTPIFCAIIPLLLVLQLHKFRPLALLLLGVTALSLSSGTLLQRREATTLTQLRNGVVAPEIAVSPSLALFIRYGVDLAIAPALNTFRYSQKVTVHGSSGEDLAGALTDRNLHTRWRASPLGQEAQQRGNEWLLIEFSRVAPLRALNLDCGHFITDFPRALRVFALPECTEGKFAAPEKPLLEYSPWLGPLLETASHHPYLGSESDVRLTLPGAPELKCVLIQQTGTAPFDWSIAELKILR